MLRRAFVDDTLAAVDALARATADGCDVIVGFVDRSAAGRPQRGRRAAGRRGHGTLRECKLPNYGVFDERADVRCRHRRCHGRGCRHRRRPVDLRGRLGAGPTVRPLRRHADRRQPQRVAVPSRQGGGARRRPARACRRDRRLDRLRQRRRRAGRAGVRRRIARGRTGRLGRPAAPRGSTKTSWSSRSTTMASPPSSGRPGPASPRRSIARSCSARATTFTRTASSDVVLGLSGGVDSAFVATIAADALGRRRRARPSDAQHVLEPGQHHRCRGCWRAASGSGSNRCDHRRLPRLEEQLADLRRGRGPRRGEPPGTHPG